MNQRPWQAQYDPEVPFHLNYDPVCIHDFLALQSARTPSREALIFENKKVKYEELYTWARLFSISLIRKGLKTGDRVAICLPNSIDFVVAFYGTLMAGGVVAAMNPNYPLTELKYQIAISKPKILIGQQSRINDLEILKLEFSINEIVMVEDNVGITISLPFSYDQISKTELSIDLPEIGVDQTAVMQFSGGTTGNPKAAMASHRSVAANVQQFCSWLTTMKNDEEVFLTAIPLYHVYGMVIGLNVGIALGATIILTPDAKDINQILTLAKNHQVTFFPGVPSLFHAINHHPDVVNRKINLPNMKACISGSAPLHKETRETFEAFTGAKLVEGYGLSEAPTATHCNPIKGENRCGSIGLPLPDVDCRIVDFKEKDKEVCIGDMGELIIQGPQLMQGYFNADDETCLVLRDGWLYTGDIARMDQDGYFYIVGRLKDLIKVNGLQVWPSEVEKVILGFPGVIEAAVAGVADEETGEVVKAWLVVADAEKFCQDDLLKYCRSNLAAYKIPTYLELIPNLPKSMVGKVLRRELVRIHLEKK